MILDLRGLWVGIIPHLANNIFISNSQKLSSRYNPLPQATFQPKSTHSLLPDNYLPRSKSTIPNKPARFLSNNLIFQYHQVKVATGYKPPGRFIVATYRTTMGQLGESCHFWLWSCASMADGLGVVEGVVDLVADRREGHLPAGQMKGRQIQ